METPLVYKKTYVISDTQVDRFGRLRPAALLEMTQEVATAHAILLRLGRQELEPLGLFWAIIRQSAQINRLPRQGETVVMETWPGIPTRTAFPRHIVARTPQGEELFRLGALWLFMNRDTREMVLPKNSGVVVPGIQREGELPLPKGLGTRVFENRESRRVRYSELDCNGHLNNTKYANWMEDVLPLSYHETHSLRRLHICYTHEALCGQEITLRWALEEDTLGMEAVRCTQGEQQHIFLLRAQYAKDSH